MACRRGTVGEIEACFRLICHWSDSARPASSHISLIMPRKAAPKVTEDGDSAETQAPRRSTRISSQPKPAEEPAKPARKPAAPRKKRNADEADTRDENDQEDNVKKVGIFFPYCFEDANVQRSHLGQARRARGGVLQRRPRGH